MTRFMPAPSKKDPEKVKTIIVLAGFVVLLSGLLTAMWVSNSNFRSLDFGDIKKVLVIIMGLVGVVYCIGRFLGDRVFPDHFDKATPEDKANWNGFAMRLMYGMDVVSRFGHFAWLLVLGVVVFLICWIFGWR